MKKQKLFKSFPTKLIIGLLLVAVLAVSVFATFKQDFLDAFFDLYVKEDTVVDLDSVSTETGTTYVPEKRTYTRPEETYEGVQGIILRSAASGVDASVVSGTQVTDYMIIADSTSPTTAIANLRAVGVNAWISVPLTGVDSDMVSSIDAILAADDVDGIELDFCGMPSNPGETNSDVNSINAFVGDVAALIAEYETTCGHDIKLSAKVYCDINTNYGFGIDVAAWVAADYIDMITPASGSDISNTDMSIRLWTSLVDPYGVVLAPHIAPTIKHYESSTAVADQTAESLAGEAAFAISQGADKISVADYIDASLLNVIGSYDTVMAVDRVHHVSYNTTRKAWTPAYNQLPRSFYQSTNAIRIPMGNIPENATVTVRITYNTTYFTNTNSYYVSDYPTTVPSVTAYVNSQPCTYKGYVNGTAVKRYSVITVGYNATTYDYIVPTTALDGGYAVFELIPPNNTGYTLTGIQLIVDVQ